MPIPSALTGPEGLGLSVCEPMQLMEALAVRGCNQVLWECGPELAAGDPAGLCTGRSGVPKLMGGTAARTLLRFELRAMDQVLQGDGSVHAAGS